MDVSALEQSIACTSDQGAHYKEVVSFLANPDVDDAAVLRLVLLFSLRYEGSGDSQVRARRPGLTPAAHHTARLAQINRLKQMMLERGMPHSTVALVDVMLRVRTPRLIATPACRAQSITARSSSSMRAGRCAAATCSATRIWRPSS